MADLITIDRAVVQQALEALEDVDGPITALLGGLLGSPDADAPGAKVRTAITALRAALAQAEPVQGPFALPCPTPKACREHCCSGHCIPRATSPQQAEPLTEEEIDGLMQSIGLVTPSHPRNIGAAARARRRIARAVEAMLAAREAK